MAGLGFDAAMMADAPEALKAKVGWLAYAVSGARNLRGPEVRVRISADDRPPVSRRVRTVLVGNCGTLTGGIVLLPDAEVDDGWLDAVTMSPKGLVAWAAVAAKVVTKGGHDRVEHYRCREFHVTTDRPQEAQARRRHGRPGAGHADPCRAPGPDRPRAPHLTSPPAGQGRCGVRPDVGARRHGEPEPSAGGDDQHQRQQRGRDHLGVQGVAGRVERREHRRPDDRVRRVDAGVQHHDDRQAGAGAVEDPRHHQAERHAGSPRTRPATPR
nr:hypothetical protein [Angustibacter aerolatus]